MNHNRSIRRQVIKYCIDKTRQCRGAFFVKSVKDFVRYYERKNYGQELKYIRGIEFAIDNK